MAETDDKLVEDLAWGKNIPLKKAPQGEKQKLLQMSEISLLLDTYEDIFSDFDPRPFSNRALSEDFLTEAKNATREKKTGDIELKFMIPRNKVHQESENLIRKRLHEHFRKHHALLHEEIGGIRKKGIVITVVGMLIILAESYIYSLQLSGFIYNLLFVILEPMGWFVTWFGLDQIFYMSSARKPDLKFYEKMSKCSITFTPY